MGGNVAAGHRHGNLLDLIFNRQDQAADECPQTNLACRR